MSGRRERGHTAQTLCVFSIMGHPSLKKETFQDMLSRGTLEVVARYQWARSMAALAKTEAKQQVQCEFREATEKDFWSGTVGGGNVESSKMCAARVGHC